MNNGQERIIYFIAWSLVAEETESKFISEQ